MMKENSFSTLYGKRLYIAAHLESSLTGVHNMGIRTLPKPAILDFPFCKAGSVPPFSITLATVELFAAILLCCGLLGLMTPFTVAPYTSVANIRSISPAFSTSSDSDGVSAPYCIPQATHVVICGINSAWMSKPE
uniref:Uncharacterized protein n=1 Tax=Cacopsylla melanoneura TaxID=428564 RepID=A0A8D8W9N7_9HEMI